MSAVAARRDGPAEADADLRQLTGQARALYWQAHRAGDAAARFGALELLARLSLLRRRRAERRAQEGRAA